MPPVQPAFGSDEILWYDNGRWGEAGYAIPNPAAKTFTLNTIIAELVQIAGRSLFELMHRQDVKFARPPQKQFWYDLHQLIVVSRKRLADESVSFADGNYLEPKHVTPTPRMFTVYPVPFFGERIRQPDVRRYCETALFAISEMMQHSDNERQQYVTQQFAADVGAFLQEILAKMSMKYFNKSREEVYKPDFALKDVDFTSYDPAGALLNVEMTEERQPLQWWPTESDLSDIRGLPVTSALPLAKRWPSVPWLDAGDGNVLLEGGTQKGEAANSFAKPVGKAPSK